LAIVAQLSRWVVSSCMGGPQLDSDQQCRVDPDHFSPVHIVRLVGELREQIIPFR
jgi:hypothetical protein